MSGSRQQSLVVLMMLVTSGMFSCVAISPLGVDHNNRLCLLTSPSLASAIYLTTTNYPVASGVALVMMTCHSYQQWLTCMKDASCTHTVPADGIISLLYSNWIAMMAPNAAAALLFTKSLFSDSRSQLFLLEGSQTLQDLRFIAVCAHTNSPFGLCAWNEFLVHFLCAQSALVAAPTFVLTNYWQALVLPN